MSRCLVLKKIFCVLGVMVFYHTGLTQASKINNKLFFLDDRLIEVTLTTDIKNLRKEKARPVYQPAKIVMKFSDTLTISEEIRVQPRGEYRKKNCDLAALMFNFKSASAPLLSPLKKLKLVGGCKTGSMYEELVLKEYLVYKIHNMLSNMSFRVRLMRITYHDNKENIKPITQYAFLLEDMEELAERNNCVEIKNMSTLTESTEREQMTFVALFQYMIGNTDWSIPNLHNMKLMAPKTDTLARPYAIPYDFDYAGLVDAHYAVPAEVLEIENVKDRLYRGFARGYDELIKSIRIFNEKKESILYFIEHFDRCSERTRRSMISYLDEFYKIINNKSKIESIFIRNTRIQ